MASFSEVNRQLDDHVHKLDQVTHSYEHLTRVYDDFLNNFKLDQGVELDFSGINFDIPDLNDVWKIEGYDINWRDTLEIDEAENELEKVTVQSTKVSQKSLQAFYDIGDGISRFVDRIVSAIKKIFDLMGDAISFIGKTIDNVKTGVSSIISLFGNLGNRVLDLFNIDGVSNANSEYGLLGNTIEGMVSSVTDLADAFHKLFNNEMVESAKELLSAVQSMNQIMGEEMTNGVINTANMMESKLGISSRNTVQSIGELSGVMYGLGIDTKHLADSSTGLVTMANYLAMMGMAGGDTEKALTKIKSGMRGYTASIDDLGMSVRSSSMNSFLKSLKAQGGAFADIETSYRNMNEEARVYARLASVNAQFMSKHSLEKYARSLDTVSGRLNIMNQTWANLTSTIGTAIAKIGAIIAGYLIPIIKMIEDAVTWVFGVLSEITGINLNLDIASSNTLNWGTEEVDNTTDAVDDLNSQLEETEKAANKAKGALMGFDKVNNINPSESSSDVSVGGFDYSSLLDIYKLDTSPYEKITDDYFAKLKEKWGGFAELAENLGELADTVTHILIPAFKRFYDSILRPIFEALGIDLNNALDKANAKIVSFTDYLKENGAVIEDEVVDKLTELWDALNGRMSIDTAMENSGTLWGKFLDVVIEVRLALEKIPSIIKEIVTRIGQVWTVLTKGQDLDLFLETNGTAWGTFLNVLSDFRRIGLVAIDVVKDLAGSFGEFAKDELLPWLIDNLHKFTMWFSNNSGTMTNFIKEIGGIAWDGLKVVVDLIGKLVGYLGEHPDALLAGVSALGGLKVIGEGIKAISGAGLGMLGISTLIGGSGAAGAGAGLAGVGAALAPMLSTVAAVGALGVAITNTYRISESFRESISEVFNGLALSFENVGIAFDGFRGAFDKLCVALEPILTYWIQRIGYVVEFVTNTVSNIMNLVTGIINLNIPQVLGAIGGLIDGIIDLLAGAVINLVDAGANLILGLLEGILGSENGFLNGVRGLCDRFVNWFKGIFGIHSPSTLFADFGRNIVEGLKNGLVSAWDGLISKFGDLITRLKNFVSEQFDGLVNGFNNLMEDVSKAVSSNPLVSGAKTVITSATEYLTGKANRSVSIPTYSTGGLPGKGLMVYNEGNGEILTELNGKTAVANQEQIIAGVSRGVADGVAKVLSQSNNKGGNTIVIPDQDMYSRAFMTRLVRELTPYLNSAQINIANRSFGI